MNPMSRLNSTQQFCVLVGVWLSAGMIAYPPWVGVFVPAQGNLVLSAPAWVAMDYAWIWAPPWTGCQVDLVRLGVQLVALWLLVVMHAAGSGEQKTPSAAAPGQEPRASG